MCWLYQRISLLQHSSYYLCAVAGDDQRCGARPELRRAVDERVAAQRHRVVGHDDTALT